MKNSLEDVQVPTARGLLDEPSPEIRKIVRQYVKLSVKQNPTEDESDRLEDILKQAETDDRLALWIVALDAAISRKMGLLDNEHYADYERQHDLLATRLSEHTNHGCYEGSQDVLVHCASVPHENGRASISQPSEIEQSFSPDYFDDDMS